MGSFNTTCFASGQTVAPGDKCYMLPVIQAHTFRAIDMTYGEDQHTVYGVASQTCYPNAFWQPYGGFIEAKYDDCGSVTLRDTPVNRLRLAHFFMSLAERAAVVAQGKNQYHDVPFDMPAILAKKVPLLPALMDRKNRDKVTEMLSDPALFAGLQEVWAYVADAISEHRVFAVDRTGHPFQVEFAVLHGTAYQNLIGALEAEKNFSDEPLDRRSFFDRAIVPGLAKLNKDMAGFDSLPADTWTPEEAEIFAKVRGNILWLQAAEIYEGLGRLGEQDTIAFPTEALEVGAAVRMLGTTPGMDEVFEKVKPALDARYILAALDMLNIRITPMVYAGQDYKNSIGSAFSKFVQATRSIVDEQRRNR